MGDLRSDRCDRSRLAIQIDYPRLLCMVYDVWERKRGNDNVTMMPEGGGRYGRTEVQTTDELLGGYKKEQGQLALFHIEPTAGVQGLIPDPLKVVARLLASPHALRDTCGPGSGRAARTKSPSHSTPRRPPAPAAPAAPGIHMTMTHFPRPGPTTVLLPELHQHVSPIEALPFAG